MNVLVTGGCGFVGTNLVQRLLLDGHRVHVIDNYLSGSPFNKIEGAQYYEYHTKYINDKSLIDVKDIHVVFHLGEYSRIHPSFEDYSRVFDHNVTGTFEVIKYCKENSIKIVYAASSTKFAAEGVSHSPYSFTKNMSVELIKSFNKWYGLEYSICYFYNVFGKGYNSSPVPGYESVISVFEKQYKEGKPLTVTGDGLQKRQFTYVGDIVDGLIKAWKYDKSEEFEFGNLKKNTILEIAKMISDNIVHIENRKGDRSDSDIRNDNARKILNWNTTIDIDEWIRVNIKK